MEPRRLWLAGGLFIATVGCGTGINLQLLAAAVGEHGQVVGIDLSPGMLKQARNRAERHKLSQVTRNQTSISDFRLPVGTTAALATASLETVPKYDAVVRDLATQLVPTRGRLAVGGLRRPSAWPSWAVAPGCLATAIFGVNRSYERIQPWRSVQRHVDEMAFETAASGALCLSVARNRLAPHRDAEPPLPPHRATS